MSSEQRMSEGWENFVTGEIDCHTPGTALSFTKDEARQYIPQTPPSLGIYDCYIALGKTPFEAMFETLKDHTQEKDS